MGVRLECASAAGGQRFDRSVLVASRAPVFAAPIMLAQAFCILIMLSEAELKDWTGVHHREAGFEAGSPA